jgi:PAS domain S-box-containing protein
MISNLNKALIWRRLLIGFLFVAAASAFRAVFFSSLGRGIPYLIYYPAVMLAALYGGLLAGFLATLLATALTYFWVQQGQLSRAEALAQAIFAISCAMVSIVCETKRRAEIRATLSHEKAEAANQKWRSEATERERAEGEIRRSEAQYRILFDTLIEGFCTIEMIFDNDGNAVDYRFLEINPAFEKQTGLQNAQGKLMRDLAPNHEAHWFEIYGKVAQTGEPARFENEARALGRYYDVSAYRVGGPESCKVAILFNDITERKHAESRIRYLNRIYAVLSDVNQTIVRERDLMRLYESACRIAIEKGGFFLAWIGFADRQSNILKVVARAGAGESFIEKLPPALGGNPSEERTAAEAWEAGARVICNDIANDPRTARWQEVSMKLGFRSFASISLYKADKVIGSFNLIAGESGAFDKEELRLLDQLALDISFAGEVHDHEAIRQRTEASNRELAQAMELAPIAILISDMERRAKYCNVSCATLFGFMKSEEMLGLKPEDVFTPSDLEVFARITEKAMATGMWKGELSLQMRSGRRIVAEHTLSIIHDENGQPTARLTMFNDVTEKRQLEEHAMRAQRLENLGMLAAGIAHDFNNALAPIAMAVPLLRLQLRDPAGLRMLDIVEHSSARGAALVRQMLSFARGASEGKQLTQVHHILKEVVELSESSFSKSIEIEAHLPNDLWPIIADPTQMHQVFLNLCVNARDAMPDGGKITVTAENRVLNAAQAAMIEGGRPGDFLVVGIRDTGTGIPAEILGKIFDPFFTTKGEGKGTGLGLSTVRTIVSNHDGFLVVNTTTDRDHGTVFTIYLPAAPGETEEISNSHRNPARRGRGELILFVDDEQPVLDLGAKILIERGGYQVITAQDGADAVAAFVPRASQVRLLVTDLDMPIVNGRKLALALRTIKPELPVIIMSGGALETEGGSIAFAAAFLVKPFEAQGLLEIVNSVLQKTGSASPFPS